MDSAADILWIFELTIERRGIQTCILLCVILTAILIIKSILSFWKTFNIICIRLMSLLQNLAWLPRFFHSRSVFNSSFPAFNYGCSSCKFLFKWNKLFVHVAQITRKQTKKNAHAIYRAFFFFFWIILLSLSLKQFVSESKFYFSRTVSILQSVFSSVYFSPIYIYFSHTFWKSGRGRLFKCICFNHQFPLLLSGSMISFFPILSIFFTFLSHIRFRFATRTM